MLTVTIKINTHAAQCNADGILSSNIRPHHFSMERTCEVIKSGWSLNGKYQWFVVKPFSGYLFVTSKDIIATIVTAVPVQPATMIDRLTRALETCNAAN